MTLDCDMVCNCDPEDWDPTQWVFSPLRKGGWFCMKCLTQLGYFRDEFTGDEEWRPKPAPISEAPKVPPRPKRGLLSRLRGVLS